MEYDSIEDERPKTELRRRPPPPPSLKPVPPSPPSPPPPPGPPPPGPPREEEENVEQKPFHQGGIESIGWAIPNASSLTTMITSIFGQTESENGSNVVPFSQGKRACLRYHNVTFVMMEEVKRVLLGWEGGILDIKGARTGIFCLVSPSILMAGEKAEWLIAVRDPYLSRHFIIAKSDEPSGDAIRAFFEEEVQPLAIALTHDSHAMLEERLRKWVQNWMVHMDYEELVAYDWVFVGDEAKDLEVVLDEIKCDHGRMAFAVACDDSPPQYLCPNRCDSTFSSYSYF